MKKMRKRLLLTVLVVVVCCCFCPNAMAASDTITLKTTGKDSDMRYELKDIYNIPDGATVTLSTDAPDVVEFSSGKIKVTKEETSKDEDDIIVKSSFTIKSNNIVVNDNNVWFSGLRKGTYYTDISVLAKSAGTAVVTMTVTNGGTETITTYNIKVKGSKPKITAKSWKKQMDAVWDYGRISIKNTSKMAKVTLSANKKNAFRIECYNYAESAKGYMKQTIIGKKAISFGVRGGSEDNGDSWRGVYLVFPLESGSLSLTVTVEQDGYKISKTFRTKAAKYENPIRTLKIGGKNYTKQFEKWNYIAPAVVNRTLPLKELKKTMKKGGSFHLKLKKGYTLSRVSYRLRKDSWDKDAYILNGTKLPKGVWYITIHYKDKKGKARRFYINATDDLLVNEKD